jgi:zinc protease
VRRVALTFAAVSMLAAGAAAQPPTQGPPASTKAAGTVLKNRAPVSKEILKVTLPKPKESDLSNGVHLIVLEDHRAPLVTLQMIVEGAGGYYDPASMPGLAGFTATLMREGTATKTSEQLSEQLDRLAATVGTGAGISSPFASVTGSGLVNNLDTVLALMADVLMHPSFPQAEIDRYKTRTRAGLMQQRSQPGFLAQERLNRVVFGDHPSSRLSPTPAALDALTRDALVEFHKTHYLPDHAVLAISGDITADQAKRLAETAFGAWPKSGQPLAAPANPPALTGPSISLVDRPKSVQTTLLVGTQSIERTNPDYDALTVANRILGGPEARLFEHLREQKGYTYGASSGFSSGRIVGSWTASTDVRRQGAGGPEAFARRRFRAPARERGGGAQQLHRQLRLQAAGGLLGHLSRAHPGRERGRRAAGCAEVLGRGSSADRRGRRRVEGRTRTEEAGKLPVVRRGRQAD